MTERLNNDFQFIEVGRKDPKKKLLRQRKKEFVEIYEPFKPQQACEQPIAAWAAATLIASGNARSTTTSPTGSSWFPRATSSPLPSWLIRPTPCRKSVAAYAHRIASAKVPAR